MEKASQMKEILKNYDIVVCDVSYKRKLLEFMHTDKIIIKVAFKSFSEFTTDILGSFSTNTIFKLGNLENGDFDLAKKKLYYSYFLTDKVYSNFKLNQLLDIKEYTNLNNNLDYYLKKRIAFIDEDSTDELLLLAIERLKKITTQRIDFINTYEENNKSIYLDEFNNIKEEVAYLVNDISEKLKLGIASNKIKINEPNSNYYTIIKEMFGLANIDISLSKDIKLIEYNYIKKFLLLLLKRSECEIYDGFMQTLNDVSSCECLPSVKSKLVQILNDIVSDVDSSLKVKDIYDYLVYSLTTTNNIKPKYENVIEFVDCFNEKVDVDDIVYFIGFNQDVIPKTYKDDEYLSDLEREELGINTSLKQNMLEKEKVLKIIKNLNNVYISYSLSSFDGNLVKSSFLDELEKECNIIKDFHKENIYHSYSLPILHLTYAKERDQYEKYNSISEKFNAYSSVFKDEKRYDFTFKKVNAKKYKEFLKPGLNLSYTSIDSFYKCPFRFYLERVLKIKKATNEDALEIGNLFHYCFCELLKQDETENISKALDELIKEFYRQENIDFANDEKKKTYISIYKEILIKNYEFIQKQMENCNFNLQDLEKEYKINIKRESLITLRGKIDKVLTLKMRGREYAIVIDYKTGSSDFSFDNVVYGLDMQLLFYFIFLNSINEVSFGGAYLASVLPSLPFVYDPKKTYDEQMRDYFLLNGYSNEDAFILSQIDSEVGTENSYLRGIKFKNDGTLSKTSYKRILTEGEFKKILDIAKEKITEAIDDIVDGKFTISPKKIGKELTCTYCPYKDICFVEEKAIVELEKKKDLSFIRGENNG